MRILTEEKLLQLDRIEDTVYLTHGFHPYPAKFPPQVPRFLIENMTAPGDTILDPFCGSGTTLVEAKLLGRNACGVDINPLATMTSLAKVTPLTGAQLAAISRLLKSIGEVVSGYLSRKHPQRTLSGFGGKISELSFEIPEFPNRDHWFQKHVIEELALVRDQIARSGLDEDSTKFLWTALSAIVVPVSNQDSETRYVAVKKDIPPGLAYRLFREKATRMLDRMKAFSKRATHSSIEICTADARLLDFLPDARFDAVVTSPPYPNTYDYYLYHKLRMFWFGLDWQKAKFNEIGSRLRHSSQKEDIGEYEADMDRCFAHIARTLKPRAKIAMVIGDSIIRARMFRGDEIIVPIARRHGFELIEKASYDLSLASKSFHPSFRNRAKKEHILILARPG